MRNVPYVHPQVGRRIAAPLLVPLVLVGSAGAGLATGAALSRLGERPLPQAQPLGRYPSRTAPVTSSPSSAVRVQVQQVGATSAPSRTVSRVKAAPRPTKAAGHAKAKHETHAKSEGHGKGKHGKGDGEHHGKGDKGKHGKGKQDSGKHGAKPDQSKHDLGTRGAAKPGPAGHGPAQQQQPKHDAPKRA